ncbi:WAT1-related protein At2g39510 [Mercurialis annua]|uniref:WAT1-related protein At2g39510 n=1 Tax=Mercurialis annua TaxID=3986 RepID=UPI00215E1BCE|nr:WAT1-related protein At2g39510 [Mercurialis annua]
MKSSSSSPSFPRNFCEKSKPFLAVILLQFGYAGMSIMTKSALNQGMSTHVLAVYRHVVATIVITPFALFFDRKVRPKMTMSTFLKIAALGLLEPTIDQNLYYTGMKYTTATFASALCNVLPAFAFLMAWILRLEKVNVKKVHSQAKILGTLVTVGGAMVMTLVKGGAIDLPWTNNALHPQVSSSALSTTDDKTIKGAIFIIIGCSCWSAFFILQAITLKTYPAELSLTALICLMGAIEGSVVALIMERGNPSAWAIHFDSKLLACVYSGIICSGVAYYVQGLIMKIKGPVFVTSFSPLSMIIVTILGSFVLSEILYTGRAIGALVIVIGLYMVLWGKNKDQSSSSLNNDEKAAEETTIEMDTINERIEISNQEFVAIDLHKVRPTNESI